MRRNPFSSFAAVALLAACGGGGDGGTPPPPTLVPTTVTVSISSADALVSLGDSRTLTAVVRDQNSAVMSAPTVTWTATPAGIVTLSPSTGLATTATAVGNGSVSIKATSGTVNSTASASVAQKLSSIVVSPATANLTVGGAQQLTLTARDARSNPITGVTGYSFLSTNSTVASVSSTGNVTAGSAGTATINVSLTRDAVTAPGSSAITVTAATFPTTATVTTGTASFSPASVDIQSGGTVTWSFGSIAHNVNFNAQTGAPAAIPTTSNASVARTFNTAGSFPYECTIHAGMTATVVVH